MNAESSSSSDECQIYTSLYDIKISSMCHLHDQVPHFCHLPCNISQRSPLNDFAKFYMTLVNIALKYFKMTLVISQLHVFDDSWQLFGNHEKIRITCELDTSYKRILYSCRIRDTSFSLHFVSGTVELNDNPPPFLILRCKINIGNHNLN